MKKSRYRETQIVKILKEVCREYGIADQTYNWKAGGMEASEIKRLKELEECGDGGLFLASLYTDNFGGVLRCDEVFLGYSKVRRHYCVDIVGC